MPHQHLCFQCLHRFQSNAHNDDDGSTADGQVLNSTGQIAANDRQQRNDCKIHCTENHNLVDDLLNEVGGRLAGTEAGVK